MAEENPWRSIPLGDYEGHMGIDTVGQLKMLSAVMAEQLDACSAASLAILGVAGGNGLEHIDPAKYEKVYGIDVNPAYLDVCVRRYPALKAIFRGICADFRSPSFEMPPVDLVIADLFIEYVGTAVFADKFRGGIHRYISCVIQQNGDNNFVSDSPYTRLLSGLSALHCDIDRQELVSAMEGAGYGTLLEKIYPLPGGKSFCRVDFGLK